MNKTIYQNDRCRNKSKDKGKGEKRKMNKMCDVKNDEVVLDCTSEESRIVASDVGAEFPDGVGVDIFAKVIGYEFEKTEIKRIVDVVNNYEKYEELGVSVPNGLLLCGKPGIGKTMLATCMMDAMIADKYIIRKDIPKDEMIVQMNNTFDDAIHSAPSVILIDDMDKFANEDRNRRDSEEYVAIQALIDKSKGKGVFVIATVNDEDKLPDSLTRAGRFDKVLHLKTPQKDEAKQIIAHYLSSKKLSNDVDIDEISRIMHGHSCADLELVVNEAGILAGYKNKDKVGREELLDAVLSAGLGIMNRNEEMSELKLKSIAYHEAGHVVVSEVLENESVSITSIAGMHSNKEGIAVPIANDDYWFDKALMENRVMMLLAGKSAYELVHGKCDTGAMNDTERAVDLVGRFIKNYCELGFSKYVTKHAYGEMEFENNEFVLQEVEKYAQKARKILIENRDFLEKLATNLMQKRVLGFKDIQAIKASCTITH